jgi:hypothetical protein
MYCTVADVLDQIRGVSLDVLGDTAAQADAVEAAAAGATADVNARCRRTFVPPTEVEAKTLDGHGGYLLRVPDLVRLDAVAVDGTVCPEATAHPSDGPPYGWVATGSRFPEGRGNVTVTGLWGFRPEVPPDVARATACLAAAEVLARVQAARSDGVRQAMAGLVREEFPANGPYSDRIAGLEAAAARLLVPYRRWFV